MEKHGTDAAPLTRSAFMADKITALGYLQARARAFAKIYNTSKYRRKRTREGKRL